MKICTKCGKNKDIVEFYKDKSKKDGIKTICILCQKEHYENNKERKKERGKEYYLKNKEKINKHKKEYQSENKEHFSKYRKNWYLNNKDEQKLLRKIYYENNKTEILKRIKENFDEKSEADPLFRFIHNLRTNIRNGIKGHGYSKKTKTYKILGIEFKLFIEYIESQFKEGMTWENYGKWHLDHKTPISWGKNEEEVIKLCHYTNYQPLWKFENLSKGNRYKS